MPPVSPSNGLSPPLSHDASFKCAGQPAAAQATVRDSPAEARQASPSLCNRASEILTAEHDSAPMLDAPQDPMQTARQELPVEGEIRRGAGGFNVAPGDVEKGDVMDDSCSCCSEEHIDFMGGFSIDSTFDPKRDV